MRKLNRIKKEIENWGTNELDKIFYLILLLIITFLWVLCKSMEMPLISKSLMSERDTRVELNVYKENGMNFNV